MKTYLSSANLCIINFGELVSLFWTLDSYIESCVSLYSLCININRYNGRSPDLKGKRINSSHMHAEKVPEWVNSSARDKK